MARTDYRFPGTDIVLQDGDLLLHYTPLPLDTFNRAFALPKGPYAHASVFVLSPNGSGRVVDFSMRGLVESDPALVLKRTYRLALVRPVSPPAPGQLAAALDALKKRVAAGSVRFDFGLRWTEEDDGQYYCTEFLSRLHRNAGLPDPFPLAPEGGESFWNQWVAAHLDLDFARIVSPNTPLHSAAYKLVAEYRNEDPAARRHEIELDTLFVLIDTYLREQGLVPAPPSAGSRFLLGLADVGLFGNELIGALPSKSRPLLMSVHEFIVRVQDRVERAVWLDEGEQWSSNDIAELTRRTANAYRQQFFVPASP